MTWWFVFVRASGHVDRFSDLMVRDLKCGDHFRADHLLKDYLEQLTSDPKCTPEMAKEYADVIAKVTTTPTTFVAR